MATLPGLVIKIGANTKDAIDGLNKVNRAVGQSSSSASRMRAQWAKVGPALTTAAFAAGGLAVAIGTQGVRAAMEEEAELAKLNRTLSNLGFGAASDQVNKFIDDLQFSIGVADSELRPALALLVTSFKDVGKAEQMLGLAADLAAAGFGTVETAASALAKAAGGNLGALQRLVKGGIDPATIKAKDLDGALAQLSAIVGGQAEAFGQTMLGRMERLKIGMQELQEQVGFGLLEGFIGDTQNAGDNAEKLISDLRNMQNDIHAIAETVGWFGKILTFTFQAARGAVVIEVYRVVQTLNLMYDAYVEIADKLGIMSDEEADRERQQQKNIKATQRQAYYEGLLGYQFAQTGAAADDAANSTSGYVAGLNEVAGAAGKAKTQLQRLQEEMDKYAKNRSIAGQKIGLAQMRQEGPGKKATQRDIREFGLNYADQASRLASDVAERGGFSEKSKRRARRILANAREYLGGLGLGENFTDANGAYLGTPDALDPSRNKRRGRRVGDYEAQKMGFPGGTTINVDRVEVKADTPAQAMQQFKQWVRLAAAGRGPATSQVGGPNAPAAGPFAPSGPFPPSGGPLG